MVTASASPQTKLKENSEKYCGGILQQLKFYPLSGGLDSTRERLNLLRKIGWNPKRTDKLRWNRWLERIVVFVLRHSYPAA
jgi:hypothetical protein